MKRFDAILLCGGRGIRLREACIQDEPKSLHKLPPNGKELIRYSVESLTSVSPILQSLIFAVDYQHEKMESWVKQNKYLFSNISCTFTYQERPDIIGAIAQAIESVQSDNVIICNTDEVRKGLNTEKAIQFHLDEDCLATVVCTHTNNLYRHRVMKVDHDTKVVKETILKPKQYVTNNEEVQLVNTGFWIFNTDFLKNIIKNHEFDNSGWSGLINLLVDERTVVAYIDDRIRYHNVGTPQEYNWAMEDLFLD